MLAEEPDEEGLVAHVRRLPAPYYYYYYYYYAGHDPLASGVDISDLIVLAMIAIVLTALGVVGIRGRDLRG